MLRKLNEIRGHAVCGLDGEIGRITDFFFDDVHWTVRYWVVDTAGFWEVERPVLISPIAVRSIDWGERLVQLNLTCERIKNSPSVDLDLPVSRQYERLYYQHYGWPSYWDFGGIWGPATVPTSLAEGRWSEPARDLEEQGGDPHLRSVREVTGYHIKGLDAEIGHVQDFVVDEASWTIRYLIVATSNWWMQKSVLLAPSWIDQIDWAERLVRVNLPREIIRKSPEYDPELPIDRDYEARLYRHYGWPTYWLEQTRPPEP